MSGTEEQGSGAKAPGGQEDQESARGGASGGSPDTAPGEPGEPVGGVPAGGVSDDRVPPDVGDGSDDDIVARQLREAAEKEEDPELREKLWDEYRAYKKGIKNKAHEASESALDGSGGS